MFKENLYPKSGLHRDTLQEQKEHNKEMRTVFFGESFDEQKFTDTVKEMFHLQESSTLEELRDVRLFAEHVIPRLTMSSVQRPHIMQRPGELFSGAPIGRSLIAHDLVHASVAYLDSGGESFRPQYNVINEEIEGPPQGDASCVREEIITLMLQGELLHEEILHFGKEIDGTLLDWVEKSGQKDLVTLRQKYGASLDEILSQKASLQGIQNYIDFLGVYMTANNTNLLGEVQAIKPEYYQQLVQNIYNNSLKDNPDPNILLHEWQRLMEPLLVRLRRKESDAQESE
jgi:hypothetical protein